VTSGLGPFYDGLLHLLLSPVDLLGLVAATLLAGLRGARAGRLTVVALPVAWFAGGLMGLNLPVVIDLPGLSILSFVIFGVLVAVDPKLPPVAVTALTVLYGILHGLLNGSALGSMGAGALSLLGIVVTVLIIALLETLSPLRKEIRERIQRVFKNWARFKQTDALENERAAIQEMARDLEARLDALGEKGTDLTDEEGPEVLYAFMGTVRGLLQAMVETQKAVGQINWGQWAAARF
jgi:urease accessory protein